MVDLSWHGPNDVLKIGAFRLEGPMVFSSFVRRNAEPSAVSTLDVFGKLRPETTSSSPPSTQLGHPTYATFYFGYGRVSYERLSQRKKWQYLSWLQDGRPAKTDEEHLLLFIQGLERRALLTGSDIPLIWTELWRLWREGDPQHYTFHAAAQKLLLLLLPNAEKAAGREHVELLAQSIDPWADNPNLPLSLLVTWCHQRFGHLPAWMAYNCGRVAPGARNTIAVQRTGEEMRQLFELRFREKWGAGVVLQLPPKAQRTLQYDPYNPSLKPASIDWRDPFKATASWNKLRDEFLSLYNQCQQDLRPLASLLGKEGLTRQSMSAWEATPPELRQSNPPALATLRSLGGTSLEQSGFGGTRIEDVATQLGIAPRDVLPADVSKRLTISVHRCQLGIEPDARLTGKGYAWNEPCVLFSLHDVIPAHPRFSVPVPPEVATRYQQCAFLLKLALYVAKAGGSVQQERLTLISAYLKQTFGWDRHEARRFKALAGLHLHHGVETSTLRMPGGYEAGVKEEAGQMLLRLVTHNGQISAPEEEALRWAWKRLGLEMRVLTRHLDEISSRGVVFLGQFKSTGVGEAIPIPPASPAPLQLDYALVAARLEETRRVQSALSQAMAEGEVTQDAPYPAESDEPIPSSQEAEPAVPQLSVTPSLLASTPPLPDGPSWDGLEARFSPLLQALVARDVWSLDEAQGLARQHQVMLSGAIETINDWAFETLGGALIWEDGNQLIVEHSLIQD